MPELPEVEWGRKIAAASALGRRIERVSAADDPIVFEALRPEQVHRRLQRARIQAVRRKGKYIWFELDRGACPIFHFGMTGAFHSTLHRFVPLETGAKDPPDLWPPRFVKLHLFLEGGAELLMVDPRRLGRIRFEASPLDAEPLCRLGPDLHDEPLGLRDFRERLAARRGMLKGVLLDQSFVCGVGNWIADEVLYQAGLDPRRLVGSLSEAELRRLHIGLYRVVRTAVRVDADKSRFPKSWLFHHRWGRQKDARTSKGERIEHVVVGGRTSAIVPKVQT